MITLKRIERGEETCNFCDRSPGNATREIGSTCEYRPLVVSICYQCLHDLLNLSLDEEAQYES